MDETILKINKETLELINDDDYLTILKIYMRNPSVFGKLYKYTQCVNVSDKMLDGKSIKSLNELDYVYCSKVVDKLYSLRICDNKDDILKMLLHYGGSVNLTMRHFISNKINHQ